MAFGLKQLKHLQHIGRGMRAHTHIRARKTAHLNQTIFALILLTGFIRFTSMLVSLFVVLGVAMISWMTLDSYPPARGEYRCGALSLQQCQ